MMRRAVVVLGMHRGGTSALAGLLVRLGVEAPRTLMPPNDFNPLGYWESEPLAAFNDRLLASAQTSWDAWTAIDEAWQISAATDLAGELGPLLSREFGMASTFVLKDPRICRLVPLWLRHLQASGIEPVPIITLRNPADVAGSLAARDNLARPFALLMWLRHMLDAERATRGLRRAFVLYDDLLKDWHRVADQIMAATGLPWPIPPSTADQGIARFLRRDLCHHASKRADPSVEAPLSDWLRRAWNGFSALAASDPRDCAEAHEALDDVRAQLDVAASLFGNADESRRQTLREALVSAEVQRGDLLRHAQLLELDRNALRDHAAGLEAERAEHCERASRLEMQVPVLLDRATTLATDVQRLSGDVAALERERIQLREHIGQLENTQASLAHDLAAARHHAAALLRSGSWRVTAPFRAILRVAYRFSAKGKGRAQE